MKTSLGWLLVPLLAISLPARAETAPAVLKVGVPQAYGYFAALWQHNVQPPGVKVEYKYFPESRDLADAVLSGAVDLEDQGEIGPIQMAAAGGRLKVVACTNSNGRNTNLIVRPGLGVKAFSDLKGHRIAYASNNNHKLFLVHLLKAFHMTDSDIKSVDILGAEAVSAMVSGQVDATSQNSPTAAQILEKVPGSTVIATGDQYGITNLYCVLATQTAAAQKVDAIKAFLRAYQTEMVWSKAHPAEYTALVAPKLGVSEHAAGVALANNSATLAVIDEPFLTEKQSYIDELYDNKIIRKQIAARDLFLTSYNDAIETDGHAQ